jgi:type IV pilus assembly protein PilB
LKAKRRLGEILLEAGVLTRETLGEALEARKQSNLKLGQILVELGILNESRLVDFLSEQLKVKRFLPDEHPVDPNMAKVFPLEVAQKHRVAPLSKKGALLNIAMTDPLDISALDTVEALTNREVDPVICTEKELDQLIGSLYGSYSNPAGLVDMGRAKPGSDIEEDRKTPAPAIELSPPQESSEGAAVVRLVNSILSQAVREKASDIHICPEKDYVQVRFRVDGKLHEVPAPHKAMFTPIVSRVKVLANMDISSSRVPQDGRFTVNIEDKEVNVRASTIPTIYGENLVLRLLDMSAGIYSLEHLGMSRQDMDKIESMITKPYGMILSSGPTGSGKTTSLYAVLQKLNQPDVNIITLEDPVEYRVEKIRQVQLNTKAGMTFASGLRAVLRQDPDIIMVGEIRDGETARIAVQAALTGHRVLSTVHTNDAAGAITRFMDMGIEPFLVSSVMLVSLAQRLIRTICPRCKEPFTPPSDVLMHWGLDKVKERNFQKGRGCFHCKNTGYKGRTGIFEVLVIDETVQEMILRRCSAQEITRAVQKAGKLRSLKEDAADKALKGITTLEEAAFAAIA